MLNLKLLLWTWFGLLVFITSWKVMVFPDEFLNLLSLPYQIIKWNLTWTPTLVYIFVLMQVSIGALSLILISLATFLMASGLNIINMLMSHPFNAFSIVCFIRLNWRLKSKTIYNLSLNAEKYFLLILTPLKAKCSILRSFYTFCKNGC